MLPAPSANGVTAHAIAPTAWVRVPPPNSRTVSDTSTTPSRLASCEAIRSAVSDAPNNASTTHPIHAVTGGKSTYPNAGWRAAARK